MGNQTHRINIRKHCNDRQNQHHHLSDVKLLLITYINFIKLTLMLLVYKSYWLLPELVKGLDLPSVYNWCLQIVVCIKSSNQNKLFKFLRLTLVAHATNVTSEPFPWLILNRLRKTCLVLQCIGVVVCSAAFFHKRKFILKTVYWNPPKMPLQENVWH